jgi:type 1 glutamine amidotransferase
VNQNSHTPACPPGWRPPASGKRQRILYFTRTVGYEHSAVHRDGDGLSFSEQTLLEMAARAGFDVDCTKDGSVFDGDLDRYDALAFYTLGDVTKTTGTDTPPMTPAGKQRLLEAIAAGKGFVGFHAATDTFYGDGLDPYIEMIGAEFCGHGLEQAAAMLRTSPDFPGIEGIGDCFRLYEEWYAFKKVSRDMHVILAMDTRGMRGKVYQRPPTPATWARMYGKGRVFYTSLGHREDVWTSPLFQQIAFAGLAWALGNVDADVTPNFDQATPEGDYYVWTPPEPGTVSR